MTVHRPAQTHGPDPEDERQVRVSLAKAGRRPREKGLNMTLVKQTGLPVEEFSKLQKAVSNLRDNLIEATGSD